ncbi:MAG: hypothetical protein PHP46_04650 [Candidatus Omnitrophica bacterium]|nr:hypothetical protein [Candidatus Omnitrophota bacterium]
MKPGKIILSIVIFTLVGLLYVHQHVELVKLSYAIDRKECILKDMLDRKERLAYNINNLEAPSRLENVLLAKKVDLVFPKNGQVFKAAMFSPNRIDVSNLRKFDLEKVLNIFGILDFLGLRAEAHARER